MAYNSFHSTTGAKKNIIICSGLFGCFDDIASFCRYNVDFPGDYVSASVAAVFPGIVVKAVFKPKEHFIPCLNIASKKVLKGAINLPGASLNNATVAGASRHSLFVMFFTFLVCFVGGNGILLRSIGLIPLRDSHINLFHILNLKSRKNTQRHKAEWNISIKRQL